MTTFHCRVSIATGKVIREFESDGLPPKHSIEARIWATGYGYLEGRGASPEEAKTVAFEMLAKQKQQTEP